MSSYVTAFITSLTLSLVLTPFIRHVAFRLGSVHYPKAISIDTHVNPIPYLGGVPIFFSFFVCALFLSVATDFPLMPVLVAATIVVLGGLIDDARTLSVAGKFVAQIVATCLILLAGSEVINIPPLFNNSAVDTFIAFIWIVGLMNAVNFLDIMDGLAGGIAAISAIGFAGMAVLQGQPVIAILAIAVAGGAVGFLVFNFNPARIFMGDTGSQFLGFMLALFPLMLLRTGEGMGYRRSLLVSLVVLGVPIFEMVYTCSIRALTGKAPWRGSKDHFALRAFAMGHPVRRIVLTTYAVCAMLVTIGLLLLNARPAGIFFAVSIILSFAGIVSVWLSHVPVAKPITFSQKREVSKS
jgi:UDP-GlcNAc:undecaprenyl-phosphate GlcNAc-1-phosphate transferase